MIPSVQEYNELLYAINNPERKVMIPVDLRSDGYPDVQKDYNYYYGENYENQFVGTIDDLIAKWPDPKNVPTFYQAKVDYYRILPDEIIYNIDLNSRTVEAPPSLGVYMDNNAEVVWFSVDRFYDDVDLFGALCYIQYKNALNENYICWTTSQVIPKTDHNKLYIPWPISIAATKAVGKVTFSFQFFKTSEDKQRVYYSINTKTATSQILPGLHVDPLDDFIEYDDTVNPQYSELLKTLNEMAEDIANLAKDYNLYWFEL